MSYKAIDIANYIFEYLHRKGEGLTPLKLQKVLYYVATTYFKKTNKHLFDEPIEKWQYGPVVPSVYHAFKGRGYGNISSVANRYIIGESIFSVVPAPPYPAELLEDPNLSLIESVINSLKSVNARDLVEKTHQEYAWKSNEYKILSGAKELTYSNEELLNASDVLSD